MHHVVSLLTVERRVGSGDDLLGRLGDGPAGLDLDRESARRLHEHGGHRVNEEWKTRLLEPTPSAPN